MNGESLNSQSKTLPLDFCVQKLKICLDYCSFWNFSPRVGTLRSKWKVPHLLNLLTLGLNKWSKSPQILNLLRKASSSQLEVLIKLDSWKLDLNFFKFSRIHLDSTLILSRIGLYTQYPTFQSSLKFAFSSSTKQF